MFLVLYGAEEEVLVFCGDSGLCERFDLWGEWGVCEW